MLPHQGCVLGGSAFGFPGGPFPGPVVLDSSRCLGWKLVLQPQPLGIPSQPQPLGGTWQAPSLPPSLSCKMGHIEVNGGMGVMRPYSPAPFHLSTAALPGALRSAEG